MGEESFSIFDREKGLYMTTLHNYFLVLQEFVSNWVWSRRWKPSNSLPHFSRVWLRTITSPSASILIGSWYGQLDRVGKMSLNSQSIWEKQLRINDQNLLGKNT